MDNFGIIVWIIIFVVIFLGRIIKAILKNPEVGKKRPLNIRVKGKPGIQDVNQRGNKIKEFLKELEKEVTGEAQRRPQAQRKPQPQGRFQPQHRPKAFKKTNYGSHSPRQFAQQQQNVKPLQSSLKPGPVYVQQDSRALPGQGEKKVRRFVTTNLQNSLLGNRKTGSSRKGAAKLGRTSRRKFPFALGPENIKTAIVWAEILGKPRSMKPWSLHGGA